MTAKMQSRLSGLVPDEVLLAIAAGKIEGYSSVNVVGLNMSAVTGGVEETIWDQGGLYPFIDSASPKNLEVVSASAADVAAGIGAQSVLIYYLDGNWEAQVKLVQLNGTTPVPILDEDDIAPANILRVNNVVVIAAGSTRRNQGIITVVENGQPEVYGYIPLNGGASRTAVYSVPAGHSLYIRKVTGNVQSNSDVFDIKLWQHRNATPSGVDLLLFEAKLLPGQSVVDANFVEFTEKTDIEMTSTIEGAGPDDVVSVIANCTLVRNSLA